MSIKTFTASLNGGDAVTGDNDLFYKIYGSADGYSSAIHTSGSHTSDADVTVTGDSVTIVSVDVGVETAFKISSIDEAGNESVLSDVWSAIDVDNLVTNQFFTDLWTNADGHVIPEGVDGTNNRVTQLTVFESPDSRLGNILKYGPGVDIGTYTDIYVIAETANAAGDYHTFANSQYRIWEFDLRTNESLILYIYTATEIGDGALGAATTQITLSSTAGAVVRKSIYFKLPINLSEIRLRYLTSNATQYWEISNQVLKPIP